MKFLEAKQILNENGYILKEAENLRFMDEIENLGFDFKEYGHKGLYLITGRKDGKLVEKWIGGRSKEDLRELIKASIK